jgi:predicted HTH transcriptional regulator
MPETKEIQQVHKHSLAAYNQLRNSQQTKLKWAKILGLLINSPPMTDKQISTALGYAHYSAVQPRISDLIKEGILEECGEIKCPESGLPVRLVRIKTNQESFL